MSFLRKFYNILLNLLFPQTCFVCKSGTESFCDICIKKLIFEKREIVVDGVKINYFLNFKNPILHQALWLVKYHHDINVIRKLGQNFGLELEKYFDKNKTFLIPIPLSKNDNRLHNHILELVGATNFQSSDILEKNTKLRQARLKHKQERKGNVLGKIHINQNKLKTFLHKYNLENNLNSIHFILIDDVVTTGSTLLEAKKVLESSGIKIESIHTLCH